MFYRKGVIDSIKTTLEDCPDALDAVGMSHSIHELFCAMVYNLVGEF